MKKITNMNNQNIIVYENGEIEIKVSIDNYNETIWLRAEDIAVLFDVQRPAIIKHVGNIYKTKELLENTTCSILEQVANDGKKRKIKYYNLDMIISIGYRVNSLKATMFRKWAINILKNYILDGYSINIHKITEQRLLSLENDMQTVKSKIRSNELELIQGIFYNGQIFDAYIFVNDLLKSAKKDIVLIDNYIDDTVLTLFSKYTNLQFTIVTKSLNKQFKLDIEKYNKQYDNLTIKLSDNYHDRFLIIDDKEVYHIGASLKDLGNKVFAFSKMDVKLLNIKEMIN